MERRRRRWKGMRRRPILVLLACVATAAATLASPVPPAGAGTGGPPAPEFAAHPTITAPPFISVRLGVDPTGPQDLTYTGCKGTDGTACWGANSGQLGDGTTTPHPLPVAVVSP